DRGCCALGLILRREEGPNHSLPLCMAAAYHEGGTRRPAMLCLHRPTPRHGKHGLEPIILLSLLVFLALVFFRAFFHNEQPLSKQLFSAFLGALQCFGFFLGLVVLLASAEMLKQTAARARARRLTHLLGWLSPWRADGRLPATPDDINNMR